jgi:hypothetical protein
MGVEVEALGDEPPGHRPRSLDLIEAQVEIRSDPPEGRPLGTSIEDGEDHLKTTEVEALRRRTKWTGSDRLGREQSPKSPRADVSTTASNMTKPGGILDDRLTRRSIREHGKGSHLVVGEAYLRMDQSSEAVTPADAVVVFRVADSIAEGRQDDAASTLQAVPLQR